MKRHLQLVALLAVLLPVASGCAAPQRPAIIAYYQYDYDYAVDTYRQRAQTVKEKDEKNTVLVNLKYAGAAIAAGDYLDSLEGLTEASKIMENVEIGAEQGQASMVLAHGMRFFKGEPYERALAYSYMGLIYYRRGDFENARAALNMALLADKSSKNEESPDYREDFTLAHYLIGKSYLKLGEADNAQISFDKVKKYMPGFTYADPAKIKDSNFTLVLEMGCGPMKRPDPFVGTVDTIHACPYQERYAEVYLNETLLGRTAKVVDMNQQAKTSGSSTRDTAQATKGVAIAVAKQLPFVGGLIGMATHFSGMGHADVRTWGMLPGEVHVLEGKVAPGTYTVQIKFFDEKGNELERYRQTHYYVTVRESEPRELQGERVYLIKGGVDRHNVLKAQSALYLHHQATMQAGMNQLGELND